MARMTRELSLVLVGSGILTAGYFLYPEEDLQAKQEEQVAQQVAGNNHQNAHRSTGHGFIWIHTGAFGRGYAGGAAAGAAAGGRSVAMGGNVSRGGFGSIGRGSVGG